MKKVKSAERDFTAEQLPHNRKEVFFDCIKLRFSLLLRCGLMLTLFLLPLFSLMLYADLLALSVSAVDMAETEKLSQLYAVQLYADLIGIAFYAVASFGFAGVMRILRQLVWGEPVFFFRDFKDGVKSGWKIYLPVFVLAGVLVCLNDFIKNFAQGSLVWVGYLPWALTAVVLLPVGLFVLAQTVVYTNKFIKYVTNGFVLYIKTAPQTLLATICLFLPLALLFIGNPLIRYPAFLTAGVLVLPLLLTAWFLFACGVFDRNINQQYFPEIYNKGMYKATEEKTQ